MAKCIIINSDGSVSIPQEVYDEFPEIEVTLNDGVLLFKGIWKDDLIRLLPTENVFWLEADEFKSYDAYIIDKKGCVEKIDKNLIRWAKAKGGGVTASSPRYDKNDSCPTDCCPMYEKLIFPAKSRYHDDNRVLFVENYIREFTNGDLSYLDLYDKISPIFGAVYGDSIDRAAWITEVSEMTPEGVSEWLQKDPMINEMIADLSESGNLGNDGSDNIFSVATSSGYLKVKESNGSVSILGMYCNDDSAPIDISPIKSDILASATTVPICIFMNLSHEEVFNSNIRMIDVGLGAPFTLVMGDSLSSGIMELGFTGPQNDHTVEAIVDFIAKINSKIHVKHFTFYPYGDHFYRYEATINADGIETMIFAGSHPEFTQRMIHYLGEKIGKPIVSISTFGENSNGGPIIDEFLSKLNRNHIKSVSRSTIVLDDLGRYLDLPHVEHVDFYGGHTYFDSTTLNVYNESIHHSIGSMTAERANTINLDSSISQGERERLAVLFRSNASARINGQSFWVEDSEMYVDSISSPQNIANIIKSGVSSLSCKDAWIYLGVSDTGVSADVESLHSSYTESSDRKNLEVAATILCDFVNTDRELSAILEMDYALLDHQVAEWCEGLFRSAISVNGFDLGDEDNVISVLIGDDILDVRGAKYSIREGDVGLVRTVLETLRMGYKTSFRLAPVGGEPDPAKNKNNIDFLRTAYRTFFGDNVIKRIRDLFTDDDGVHIQGFQIYTNGATHGVVGATIKPNSVLLDDWELHLWNLTTGERVEHIKVENGNLIISNGNVSSDGIYTLELSYYNADYDCTYYIRRTIDLVHSISVFDFTNCQNSDPGLIPPPDGVPGDASPFGNTVEYTFVKNSDGSIEVSYIAKDENGNDITDQIKTLTLGDYFLHREVE